MTKKTNHFITLKTSTLTVPGSWIVNQNVILVPGINSSGGSHPDSGCIQVTSPENDFTIYFLEREGNQDSVEKVNAVWQEIKDFNLKPAQESRPPLSDDWEKIFQVVYETPTSAKRIVIAIVRIFKQQSYLCLIDAEMTGLSRRGTELSIMLESWKPFGFKQTDIHSHQTKNWTQTQIQDFEKFFFAHMQKFQIPGATIAIIRQDGNMVYSNAFGVKQIDSNDPITIDTPFMIGSTTKPLTTLMMAKLIDQKKITWDTPIINLLQNFRLFDKTLSDKIQIRDTVSASTGLPRQDLYWLFKYKNIKPEERILQMKDMKATTGFGETFQYSNPMVMVGGYAAASAFAAQMDLENAYLTAMQQLVFDPLGMKRTVIKPSDAVQLGAALPHAVDLDGATVSFPLELEEACYSVAPAGGIWSTVNDLTRYLLLEMNNGVLDGDRIVSSESLLARRKPGVKLSENMAYGLGLFIAKEQGLNVVGHDGGTLGFSSHLFFIPEKGIGMTILVNSSFAHPFFYAVKQKFLELTFSAKQCAEQNAQFFLQEKHASIEKNSQSILFDLNAMQAVDHLLGDYFSATLGKARFFKSGDKYTLEFESWTSEVGIEVDATGKKYLALTSPPRSGAFKLAVAENDKKLVLQFGQEEHEFNFVKMACA